MPPAKPTLRRCLRCGHEWYTRGEGTPKSCPQKACRSVYWDRPRRKELTEKKEN